jgi:hypothetical protein
MPELSRGQSQIPDNKRLTDYIARWLHTNRTFPGLNKAHFDCFLIVLGVNGVRLWGSHSVVFMTHYVVFIWHQYYLP